MSQSTSIIPHLIYILARDNSTASNSTLVEQDFDYIPNAGAAIFFAALNFLLMFLSMFYIIRYRNWWALALPLGAAGFGGGFVTRRLLSDMQNSTALIIVSQVVVVCIPAFFLAFNYVVYGRLVASCIGAQYSPVRPTRIAALFIISDITTFLVQATGASMTSGNPSQATINVGIKVYTGGMSAQLGSYSIFVLLFARTQWNATKDQPGKIRPIMRYMYAMYFSSAMIIIRCIYRTAEAATNFGSLSTHEALFYIFDPLPLMIAMFTWMAPQLWPGAVVRAAQTYGAFQKPTSQELLSATEMEYPTRTYNPHEGYENSA